MRARGSRTAPERMWEPGVESVGSAGMERRGLTDFCTLLKDNNAHLAPFLLLELLEANGSTEPWGASTDDADVDVVAGALDIVWVEEFSPPERG